jgi:hypothetical protein
MVRHLIQRLPCAREVLDWASRQIYPLEVSQPPLLFYTDSDDLYDT